VIVTGSNTGLGFRTAAAFAAAGAEVVLAVRSDARGNAARDRITASAPGSAVRVSLVDLADLASVRDFVERERDRGSLDVLVANAGVMLVPRRELTVDGFERHMGTNHLGHAALILGLLPALEAASGRVVVVGSLAHWFSRGLRPDLGTAGRYTPMGAYADAKLAGLLFAGELGRRLAADSSGVTVLAAHPGWSATELVERADHPGPMVRMSRWSTHLLGSSPTAGAAPIVAAADPDGPWSGGDYVGPRWALRGRPGRARLSPAARNREAARRLFERTLDLTDSRGWSPGARA
jgi:NAD(P)-dependent dehydrogenase (short-subunit alcohol dehydrogenase family)